MTGTVALIGTGKMASGLAKRLAAAKVGFIVGSRDDAKGVPPVQAARQAEIIVLGVPYVAVGETIKSLGNVDGKILVDISNPITPDYMALTIGHTTSAAEEIQKLAPKAYVVKAFNTIFSQIFDLDPATAVSRVQVFYATDDKSAGEKVAALIETIGYDPVYSGALSNSRYLEPVGELNIHLGFALGHGPLVAPAWIKAA